MLQRTRDGPKLAIDEGEGGAGECYGQKNAR